MFRTYASRLRRIARISKALCKQNRDEKCELTFHSEVGAGLVGVGLAGDLARVLQLDAVDDELPLLALLDHLNSAAAFRSWVIIISGHAVMRRACTGLSCSIVTGILVGIRGN